MIVNWLYVKCKSTTLFQHFYNLNILFETRATAIKYLYQPTSASLHNEAHLLLGEVLHIEHMYPNWSPCLPESLCLTILLCNISL